MKCVKYKYRMEEKKKENKTGSYMYCVRNKTWSGKI